MHKCYLLYNARNGMVSRLGKKTECTHGAGVHSILNRVVMENFLKIYYLDRGLNKEYGEGSHAISEERIS